LRLDQLPAKAVLAQDDANRPLRDAQFDRDLFLRHATLAQRLGLGDQAFVDHEGGGDIENVRIPRASIMAMFPADSPKPTLDQVLMEAANQNGGTLSQTKAEEIAKDAGVFTTREDLRNALPRLRIEGTQGRRRKAR
jgi:hypothetical protein